MAINLRPPTLSPELEKSLRIRAAELSTTAPELAVKAIIEALSTPARRKKAGK